MKTTRFLLIKGLLVSILLFMFTLLNAQTPTAQIMLKNDTLLDSKTYQFDIYVRAKDVNGLTSFALNNYSVYVESNIKNLASGLTNANVSYVPNSSDLIGITPPANGAGFRIITVPKIVQLSGPLPSSNSITIYDSLTDPLGKAGWRRIGTVQLTAPDAFSQGTMDISNGNTVIYNSGTKIGKIPVDASNNLVNPILNGTITAFSVTNNGSTLSLNGSQTGVVYYLYKDASLYATQQGTGSDLSWTNLPLGTYTIRGHRTATYMYQDMLGSVTISNSTSGITEVKSNAVHVYPNPAKETITITFDQPISGEGTVEIWSITGDKLLSNNTIPTTSIQQKVDVSNLSSGTYFYIIKVNGDKFSSGKITIIK